MNILMILTNRTKMGDTEKKTGYFLKELAYVYTILKKAGHIIDFSSPRGFKTKADPSNLNYENDQTIIEFYENNHIRKKLESTMHPGNIIKDYQCIVFCGGHGTMWDFPDNLTLQELTLKIFQNRGLVGAICHGSSIFANLKFTDGSYFISGKKVSCFTDEEEKFLGLDEVVPFLLESKLKSLGAIHSKTSRFQPFVEKDNRLITAQNSASSTLFGEALVERLKYLN